MLFFYRLPKLLKSKTSFGTRPSVKGRGSILELTSKTALHVCLQRLNTMQISLRRQIKNRPDRRERTKVETKA